ncbi:uncharacterized protein FOMMEDRAFT_161185 [Fomitiporia mediterranea MF3/22]|uniref:uncharacterized protein n=1 Tax=Fomitiporia mediterranea (strain MF3/22) TaxID=694068 RepID=UPI0004408B1F|nr:uncharacterized protein FOMMEDRAFT_161185 [Fomitiporia mediterranea MF3/22]EJC98973.1 hypothetical protein FOMMEDRAFT_161185 [Fomitiporia mediterranea MF3/22]
MSMALHFYARNSFATFINLRNSHSACKQFRRWESSKTRRPDGALVVEHTPAATAPRHAPVPLVFVGSSELEGDGGAFLSLGGRLSAEAASRGFMSYQFDLPLRTHTSGSGLIVMDRLASTLRTLIRETGIPFPPILYAGQLSCLIAQTYVSSHPSYALILDSPPFSCASLSNWPGLAERLPLPLPEFTFEPKFPVLVLERKSAGGVLKTSRLVKEGADYAETCENATDVESRNVPTTSLAVQQWIDELGC